MAYLDIPKKHVGSGSEVHVGYNWTQSVQFPSIQSPEERGEFQRADAVL